MSLPPRLSPQYQQRLTCGVQLLGLSLVGYGVVAGQPKAIGNGGVVRELFETDV